MDLTVLNWAVLQLSGSALSLGLINACRLLPVFILAVPAGIIADKFDRKKVICILQLAMMLLTVLLGLTFAYLPSLGLIAFIVLLRASVSAVLVPIRSVYSTNLVKTESISSAAAVHATAMNLSRIIGPALGGFFLTIMSAAEVFYLNAASFCFIFLTLIGLEEISKQMKSKNLKGRALLGDAWRYIQASSLVKSLMVVSIVPMIFGFPYTTLMPLIVEELLGAGPFELGLLLSFSAGGAVLASLLLSVGLDRVQLGMKLIFSIVFFGISLVSVALSKDFYLSAFILIFIGFFSQIYRTSNRVAFLCTVPDEMRGRIMSIAMMDRGFIPLGTVLVTILIEHSSTQTGIIVMGLSCAACALVVSFVNKGILKIKS